MFSFWLSWAQWDPRPICPVLRSVTWAPSPPHDPATKASEPCASRTLLQHWGLCPSGLLGAVDVLVVKYLDFHPWVHPEHLVQHPAHSRYSMCICYLHERTAASIRCPAHGRVSLPSFTVLAMLWIRVADQGLLGVQVLSKDDKEGRQPWAQLFGSQPPGFPPGGLRIDFPPWISLLYPPRPQAWALLPGQQWLVFPCLWGRHGNWSF